MNTITKIDKIVRPGRTAQGTVFCRIRYTNGKLSITGVEGPLGDGNCTGSCGQIDGTLSDISDYLDGWTRADVEQFQRCWRDWHLNDMRPYSPEMRAAGWPEMVKKVMYKWEFTYHADDRRKIKADLMEKALAGKSVVLTPEQIATLKLPLGYSEYTDTNTSPEARPSYKPNLFRGNGTSTTLGWVKPEEHPEGVLGRKLNPDDEYGYGDKWWIDEVPQDVLAFLENLPESSTKPAWV